MQERHSITKIIKKVKITIFINNSCGKIFKFEVFSNYNFLLSPERLQVFLRIINL